MNKKRLASCLSVAAVGTALLPTIALAHVEPDPIAIEAGKQVTVAFTPSHGCEGSPTVAMAFKFPAEVADAVAVDKQGWTTATAAGVVSFTGGSAPATSSTESFQITFTAPPQPGTLVIPTVQTCAEGVNNWIELPNPDGSEADLAAPALKVAVGPPTEADLAEEEQADREQADQEQPTNITVANATVTNSAPSNDDDSNSGLILTLVAIGVIGGAGAAYVAARRRRR